MSYLSNFENDIFVSYTYVDNKPLLQGEKGWISNFHHSLGVRLHQLLGEEATIWRDPKLKGNDYLSDTLQTQFPKTAVLISVLSPRYIKSEWCLKEIDGFVQAAETSGGVKIDNKSRLFKVVKTPVPRQNQPSELQGLRGYDFYEEDQATSKPREFRQDVAPNKDQRYWDKFEDVAYEIYEFLVMMRYPPESTETAEATKKKSIYLAETTSDLRIQRDKIKRELELFGYRTFPDVQLPLDATVLEAMVRTYLENSRLSVHLIGANYGVIPEAEEAKRSVVRLQYEIAGELCTNSHFCRIIWLPPDLQAKESEQEKFIAYLQTDREAQKGAEILQTPLEELKTLIQEKLRNGHLNGHKEQIEATTKDRPLSIYLIHDKGDEQSIKQVKSYLFDQGYEVICPLFEGEESRLREDHNENLVHCDAVLIYNAIS